MQICPSHIDGSCQDILNHTLITSTMAPPKRKPTEYAKNAIEIGDPGMSELVSAICFSRLTKSFVESSARARPARSDARMCVKPINERKDYNGL